MTADEAEQNEAGATEALDQFIPVRKTDLLTALLDQVSFDGNREGHNFHRVCRLLVAIYHYTYFEQLERLRSDYFYFNPELNPHACFDREALERAYADLLKTFTTALEEANFVEIPHAEI